MHTSTNIVISFILLEEISAENSSMRQKLDCLCLETVLLNWILKYAGVAKCLVSFLRKSLIRTNCKMLKQILI